MRLHSPSIKIEILKKNPEKSFCFAYIKNYERQKERTGCLTNQIQNEQNECC